MAQVTYLVRVKNQEGVRVAEFAGRGRNVQTPGGLVSFVYEKRLNAAGSSLVRIDGLDERIAYLDLDESLTLDSQLEFWRRDLMGGPAYATWLNTLPEYQLDPSLPGWYKDFEVFHRAMEFTNDEQGREIFTSHGRGYNDLLAAEPIRYAAGSSYADKTGASEDVIKAFVNENIGPDATVPPRDRSGVMPGLTIEASAGTGANWAGARANKNLLNVCAELAEYGPGDFFVIGTGPASFQFKWRYPRWGKDKTIGNTDGNPPVVFSSTYGTATGVSYTYSRMSEINTVDVLGIGKGADRQIVTVSSGGESDSPWARRAVARDARDEHSTAVLQDRGEETLSKYVPRRVFRFEAMQTIGCRYGRDWDAGDLVSLVWHGRQITQKIIGVTVSVNENGQQSIRPITEDV